MAPTPKPRFSAARSERPEITPGPGITQDWVLRRLVDIVERSLPQEPGDAMVNATGANRALELIGKHLGMFKDRPDPGGPEGGPAEDTLRIEFVRPSPPPLARKSLAFPTPDRVRGRLPDRVRGRLPDRVRGRLSPGGRNDARHVRVRVDADNPDP